MPRFEDGSERESLAPVIPIFGGAAAIAPPPEPAWNATWADDPEPADDGEYDRFGNDTSHLRAPDPADAAADARDRAEKGLLKKLRARSLSLREARTVLREHDLDDETSEELIASFERLGYLDDAKLAEQIVHSGSDRKGQGRKAIAQTLAKRGIARDIADSALDELPDDDLERALEFARTKASSMRGLERDVALRRLAGQLARRGYGGPVAMNAARQALDELNRPVGRVRFE
ncbi:regulatory protein RecX [Microbacterium sp. NEAU-LLC]|uniref:Regulatory protein RecX n=1 Tax=Microbacterium helvum TaxID=2773713 RepID=A0ABR8NSU4_9MICO|nr:regulatory protein RecX [Microbacterium helvum]MBD3943692.1 regulatory protein RecX [Microbacterium helvum]